MRIIVGAMIGAFAVALAPTVWADDADFLSALRAAGISVDAGGGDDMVALGHLVCDDLARDVPAVTVGGRISNASGPRMQGTKGPWVIVDVAIRTLCPQHMDQAPSLG